MKLQTENIAFSGDQMIACPACGKPNPPNRAGCLYCAAPIEVPEDRQAAIRLNLRKLEGWENGYNIVLTRAGAEADTAAAAAYFKIEKDLFAQMLAAHGPFPIARIESETEANIAVKQLEAFGLSARVVSDIDLKVGKPNTRLRSVEFRDEGVRFAAFNTGEQQAVGYGEIVLIVVGRIVESKTESIEKGKKDKRKVLAETALSSDDLLVDIYDANAQHGWRVTTKGFDFSTLGPEKSLLAVENIRVVLEKLQRSAPAAKMIDEYAGVIGALSEVWDIERRTDFEGLKRTGVLKTGFSSIARTSNLEQFNKYSRLQRLML